MKELSTFSQKTATKYDLLITQFENMTLIFIAVDIDNHYLSWMCEMMTWNEMLVYSLILHFLYSKEPEFLVSRDVSRYGIEI